MQMSANQFTRGFSPNRWNIPPLWLLLTVLSCPFFLDPVPRSNSWTDFMLFDSNNVFPRKQVPFGGYDRWRHLGKICAWKPLKVGVNKQFQAKMPKYKRCTISKTKPKFEDEPETTSYISWVGYHYPKPNPTPLTAAILKVAMTS